MRGETKMNTQILSKATCRVLFAAVCAATTTLTVSAASTTYYHVNNWEMPGLPSGEDGGVEITATPQLAFPGVTLDEIKHCTFTTSLYGNQIDNDYTTAWGLHPVTCASNSDLLALQFAMKEVDSEDSSKPLTKGVIIVLSNGAGGVYARWAASFKKYGVQAIATSYSKSVNADGTVTIQTEWLNDSGKSSSSTTYNTDYRASGIRLHGISPVLNEDRFAFKDATLKQLRGCVFMAGYWAGKNMDGMEETGNEATYVTNWPSDDDIQKIVMQFTASDNDRRTAIIELTQKEGGVYAKHVLSCFKTNGSGKFYEIDGNGNISVASGVKLYTQSGNYPVHELYALCLHEWTLDADKTWTELSGGVTSASDDLVRITVTDLDAALTVNENVNVGRIEFEDGGEATMIVSPGYILTAEKISGIGNILNGGTLVKKGYGTATLPFNNASTGFTVVSNGTLKVERVTGSGDAHVIRVVSGATFDLNGKDNLAASMRVEGGAKYTNTSKLPRHNYNAVQPAQLILDGDATVTATQYFGLNAPSHAPTKLDLGSNTLTVNGGMEFMLYNTTIIGSGKVVVEAGKLTSYGFSQGSDCGIEVRIGGTLNAGQNGISICNLLNQGTVTDSANFTVTGTLTSGNDIPKLTLASGATVKASAITAQTVSKTFNVSGTITIDASAIAVQQLKDSADGRIAVLTVPSAANTSGAKWKVSNEPIRDTRIKWVTNGDTKTLYLAKPNGMILVFR